MAGRYNEGKAIDAVLRRIEAREGTIRLDDGRSPDDLKDPDVQRRVDYVCTIGDQLFAFEHTGIEPFPDHIKMEVDNGALFGPVVARLDGKRSDGEFWELHVPVDASVGLTAARARQVGELLIKWIEDYSADFPLVRYGDRFVNPHHGETTADVPFPFSLHRWSLDGLGSADGPSPLSGRFWVKYFVAADLATARVDRLKRVCADKFPKLAVWKRDSDAKTVLILEENDISLTNHQLVADAMARAEAGVVDPPDEIFVVSTHNLQSSWWVTCLRRDGATYYDDGERFHEYDPAALRQLTKR